MIAFACLPVVCDWLMPVSCVLAWECSVSVTGMATSGTVTITLRNQGTGIRDLAGNNLGYFGVISNVIYGIAVL